MNNALCSRFAKTGYSPSSASSTTNTITSSGSMGSRTTGDTNFGDVHHLPPLVVRIGIISSAVGLATPLFATAGIIQLWYFYLPRSMAGLWLKYIVGFFGGGGVISILYNYAVPFLRDHSNFVLPFAIANGVTSAFWFLIGESAFGLPFMTGVISVEILKKALPAMISSTFLSPAGGLVTSGLPIGGAVVGALTALTAPFLWPLAFTVCWDDNLRGLVLDGDSLWLVDLYQYFGIPIGLPIGIISGLSMHYTLKSAIVGTPGVPWVKTSLPVLGVLIGISSTYFYFFQTPSSDFMWEARMDHKTGEIVSYNPTTNMTKKGIAHATTAGLQRDFAASVHDLRQPLKFLQNSIFLREEKERIITAGPASIEDFRHRKDIFEFIDYLVRLKYLQLQVNKEDYHRDVAALNTTASKTIGIDDLEGFLKTIELAVIAKRRNIDSTTFGEFVPGSANKTESSKGTVTGKKTVSDLSERLKQDGVYYNSSKSNSSKSVSANKISLLFDNLSIFEDELYDKLQFKIADTCVKENEMLTAYNRQNNINNIYVVLYLGGFAALLIGMASLNMS